MKALFQAIKSMDQEGGSAVLDRVQDAISKAFTRIGDVMQNDRLIPAVFATLNGAIPDLKIAHGLGSAFKSWEVVRKSADANVWEAATTNPDPTRYIILSANAPVSIVLRVS